MELLRLNSTGLGGSCRSQIHMKQLKDTQLSPLKFGKTQKHAAFPSGNPAVAGNRQKITPWKRASHFQACTGAAAALGAAAAGFSALSGW